FQFATTATNFFNGRDILDLFDFRGYLFRHLTDLEIIISIAPKGQCQHWHIVYGPCFNNRRIHTLREYMLVFYQLIIEFYIGTFYIFAHIKLDDDQNRRIHTLREYMLVFYQLIIEFYIGTFYIFAHIKLDDDHRLPIHGSTM